MERATLDFDGLELRGGDRIDGCVLTLTYDVDCDGSVELKEAMNGCVCLYSVGSDTEHKVRLSDKQVADIEEWLTEIEATKTPAARDYDAGVGEW